MNGYLFINHKFRFFKCPTRGTLRTFQISSTHHNENKLTESFSLYLLEIQYLNIKA